MKGEIVKLKDGSVYLVKIPETASEGIISLQDSVILELLEKIKKFENILSNEREGLGKHECKNDINCSHRETRKVDGYISECYKCGTIIINMNN